MMIKFGHGQFIVLKLLVRIPYCYKPNSQYEFSVGTFYGLVMNFWVSIEMELRVYLVFSQY
jgi:hypothetical protein